MRSPATAIAAVFCLFLSLLCSSGFAAVTGGESVDWQASQQEEATELGRLELELEQQPDSQELLQRLAYLHLRQGWLFSQGEEQKRHYLRLRAYADRAAKLAPKDYRAKLLQLIGWAKTTCYLPSGEQVQQTRELHDRLEELLAEYGDDPDCLYILSWLNFKVARLSDIERFVASLLYGGLPEDVSVEEAIELLERAIELRPGYLVYLYDLAQFHERSGNLEQAYALYSQLLSQAPQSSEEELYRQKAQVKIAKLDAGQHPPTN